MSVRGRNLIVVAVDDSKYAPTVAKEAARMALERKADVVFLSVIQVPSLQTARSTLNLSTKRKRNFRTCTRP